MSDSAVSSKQTTLSIYGYGMMSFATALAALIYIGFFTSPDSDLVFGAGVSVFAGASGALALANIRAYFPQLTVRAALIASALMNLFLFGCYITSYFAYRRLYLMVFYNQLLDRVHTYNFWPTIQLCWATTLVGAMCCTLVYAFVHWCTGGFSTGASGEDHTSHENAAPPTA